MLVPQSGFGGTRPSIRVLLDPATKTAPRPGMNEIYERIRQRWQMLLDGYNIGDARRNPSLVISNDTPTAVLERLEMDGRHFRRDDDGDLVMY
ncbi:hypothetical protein pqer_cds_695 [Pandoravirus quercus]|uniref:Uncharacterized protein n=1 Tax=Pandoravirus quercus TaxID=2107709 RepID=A0A2U7U9J4_9VIRU|nr:hypothetical protein pqer_cds_695 [Pandoravirus quercus]AVK75117.1 hypothetical protein pqer_cds_695 [Pandoravirus quercus]